MKKILLICLLLAAKMISAQSVGVGIGGSTFKPIMGRGNILGFPEAKLESSVGYNIGADLYLGFGKRLYMSVGAGRSVEVYNALHLDNNITNLKYQYNYWRFPVALHLKSETRNDQVWWHMTVGGAKRIGRANMNDYEEVTNPLMHSLMYQNRITDVDLFGGLGLVHNIGSLGSINYMLTMQISPFTRKGNEAPKAPGDMNRSVFSAADAFSLLSKGGPMFTIRFIPGAFGADNNWSRSCN